MAPGSERLEMPHLRAVGSIAVAVFTLFGPAAEAGSDMARVVRVISGDTVVLRRKDSEEKVKLAGVICPDPQDQQIEVSTFGNYALAYLDGVIQKGGGWVAVERDESVGKAADGTPLVYLYTSRTAVFINEQLLLEGYGIAHSALKHRAADVLTAAENKARSTKKGLWGLQAERAAKFGEVGDQAVYLGQINGDLRRYDTSYSRWVRVWLIRFR
jgi:endonuclease YncB( thermonuclease family)